jgi:hypothetical protein
MQVKTVTVPTVCLKLNSRHHVPPSSSIRVESPAQNTAQSVTRRRHDVKRQTYDAVTSTTIHARSYAWCAPTVHYTDSNECSSHCFHDWFT